MGVVFLLISGVFAAGIRFVGAFFFFFLCLGALVIIAGTSFRSLIQKEVHAEMLGRVFGFVSSVGNISIPLAILISGMLLNYLPLDVVLAASGLLLMPVALGSWRRYNTPVK